MEFPINSELDELKTGVVAILCETSEDLRALEIKIKQRKEKQIIYDPHSDSPDHFGRKT